VRAAGLFSTYRPLPGMYDEGVAPDGSPRGHWRKFIEAFDRLDREEVGARWENGRRIIREHGVTYNIYGDPQGMDRPWELDIVPFLISGAEWSKIEEGLAQRTRIFNLLLKDVYGPQRLLRTGILPPALVYSNPGFLRPCHGIELPEEIYVHLHATDLARSPDGQWWVVADRTQAPSGSGYALENRIVLSRILPDEFRDGNVHRLASFFAAQRDMLRALAAGWTDNPSVVLLTPGPHNETYFEHAYLARYLGLTLVEGGDLTVRNSEVYLKTLEGLRRVDVILRRVDDVFCDPLALMADSFLGVAGLVEAVRAGKVAVANALGSSLMESPAFLAFLPGLCRHLLGEELKLPSVATWWCGQADEQKYVLEHLERIVVKPAFGRVAQLPFFGRALSNKKLAELREAIAARPFEFVGQEQVSFSTSPAWVNNVLEPRGVVLRAYAAASGGSHAVMPGGLARVSARAGDPVVSMQSGGGSKDAWVLSDTPVAPVTLLTPAGQPAALVRTSLDLPSRVADNLFWLGRYAERLEGALRAARSVISRMSAEVAPESAAELAVLARALAAAGRIPKRFGGRVPLKDLEAEILEMVYNAQREGSARELVLRIRQIASMVRDRLSADTWRILNQLHLDARSKPGRLPLVNAMAVVNTLIVDLAAFSGMEMENMTRGHAWHFLDFGRRLERASNLVELTRAGLQEEGPGASFLGPLLEIADSTMTYRRRYFAQPQFAAVLDLLLLDYHNPRSLAFQLQALRNHIRNLPEGGIAPEAFQRLGERVTRIGATIGAAELAEFSAAWNAGRREPALNALHATEAELGGLSNKVTALYMSLTVPRAS